jgi:TatA/E family protein of Tat protein translocase
MPELMLILVVALLVFGPNRLPELARSLGKGLAEFRRASTDLREQIMNPPPAAPPAATAPDITQVAVGTDRPVPHQDLATQRDAEPAPVARPDHTSGG